MSKQIIKAFPDFKKEKPKDEPYLNVAEFFYDTIQGEGVSMGVPAAFLRLQNCTLNCQWCDTTEVWRRGNPYNFEELFEMMEKSGGNTGLTENVIERMYNGQHLVLTGGSPLLQQKNLDEFFYKFYTKYQFMPYIEIENECTIHPNISFGFIDQWNNSPKTSNSGMKRGARYHPKIIKRLSEFKNSWFKFVIECEDDWQEIQMDFIDPGLIKKDQIILMPQAVTDGQLEFNGTGVAELAIKHNVRYCSRLQVQLWNQTTGV